MPKPVKLIAAAALVVASPCVGTVAAWGSARAGTQYKPDPIPTSVVPTSMVSNVAGDDVGHGVPAHTGALATTGSNTVELAGKGGALVLAGGGMLLMGRRRRQAHEARTATRSSGGHQRVVPQVVVRPFPDAGRRRS